MNYLPCSQQSISREDADAVNWALSQPLISRGPLVGEFEKAIADYCRVDYAVAFSSGSAALMAAYYAAEVGPADRILTSPNSFISTVGSGVQRGATAVFCDIDRSTGNLNIEQLAISMNDPSIRGKTVIVVPHFAGTPVDMAAIDEQIADPRTVVIEDAGHALGSCYKDGQRIGCCASSDLTVLTFQSSDTITTGEGGMVTTNNPELYHRLRLFRNNGIECDPNFLQYDNAPWYYEVVSLTGNYHLTEMQAALGLSQLMRIDYFINKRQQLLQLYREKLANFPHLQLLSSTSDPHVCPNLCVIQVDFKAHRTSRTAVVEQLKERDIGTRVHFIPLYRHPIFRNRAGDLSEYFPEMEAYYAETLSLPFYTDLHENDVNHIVRALKEVL